jgi:hypothetical protein
MLLTHAMYDQTNFDYPHTYKKTNIEIVVITPPREQNLVSIMEKFIFKLAQYNELNQS